MRLRLTIISVLFITNSFGQSKVRLPIWTFNTKDTKIFGLAVGYTTTQRIQNVNTNGVRFELLGLGVLLPLIPDAPIAKNDSTHNLYLKAPYTERINGFNISPIGTGCDCKVNGLNIYGVGSIIRQVNGISASFVMNITEVQNGIQGSIFFNWTYNMTGIQASFIGNTNYGTVRGLQVSAQNLTNQLKGVQIGLYNKTTKIKGLQIGLWNVNEKRKLPLINF